MSVESTLAAGRAAAAALRTSTGTFRRRGAKAAQTPDGKRGWVWTATHTAEPVRYRAAGSGGVVLGGVTFQEATGVLDARWDLPDVQDGDLVDLTSGESSGTVVQVVKALGGDQRTARRLPVREVPRPEEW